MGRSASRREGKLKGRLGWFGEWSASERWWLNERTGWGGEGSWEGEGAG